MTLVTRCAGNDEANQDGAAVANGVLSVEFSTAFFEAADSRSAECPRLAIGEIQAPLFGGRIEKAKGESFDVSRGAIHFKLDEVGAAIPDFRDDGGSVVFDPGG